MLQCCGGPPIQAEFLARLFTIGKPHKRKGKHHPHVGGIGKCRCYPQWSWSFSWLLACHSYTKVIWDSFVHTVSVTRCCTSEPHSFCSLWSLLIPQGAHRKKPCPIFLRKHFIRCFPLYWRSFASVSLMMEVALQQCLLLATEAALCSFILKPFLYNHWSSSAFL